MRLKGTAKLNPNPQFRAEGIFINQDNYPVFTALNGAGNMCKQQWKKGREE